MAPLEKVADYKILNKIGEGGMAEIYKALQPALKRNVVIKKLKDPNREIVARFKKEALLSASFAQENIVAIYDFIYDSRSYHLIMEYVEGEDLRTIIDHMFPLPVGVAVLIALEIARALEYTHNQNIIHRDIKPSNIIVSYEGNVKLIDFGVAKDDTNTRLTMTGLIVGTPAYMSPEQAHGDALSPRSDLYALGVLLYEMLTGLKPFHGSNNTEILAKVTRGKFTPAKRINPEITFKVGKVIKKLLRKDKNRRYRNAAALIHDLEKCVSWQVRSKKKEIIAGALESLDKTNYTTTEDTIKAAMLNKSSSFGWRATNYSITASFLICSFFLFKQFSKKELGYIQLENPAANMQLKIDDYSKKMMPGKVKIFGPYLAGTHYIEVNDPIGNSSFISHAAVMADDTTKVHIELPQNPAFSGIKIYTQPDNANITFDGSLISNNPKSYLGIAPGWHSIKVNKKGFKTLNDRRFFRAAESYILEYRLINK